MSGVPGNATLSREKSPVVRGELVSLVGYIPGVELKPDAKKKVVEISVRQRCEFPGLSIREVKRMV